MEEFKTNTVIVGAGAVGLAAILENQKLFQNKNVGIILCGGNIDSKILSSILMRDLVRAGQITTLTITMPDKPGQLGDISTLIGKHKLNITSLEMKEKTTNYINFKFHLLIRDLKKLFLFSFLYSLFCKFLNSKTFIDI